MGNESVSAGVAVLIAFTGAIIILLIVLIILCSYGIIKMTCDDSSSDDESGGEVVGGKNTFKIGAMLENRRKRRRQKRYEHRLNKLNSDSGNSGKNDPSGWQLYTLKGCPHCTHQLEDLKGFKTYVEFKRGEQEPIVNHISGPLYPKDQINGFPFWYNSKTGEKKMGRQDVCNLTPKIASAKC